MNKQYGKQPFKVVVVHGGPGAIGGVTPVAKELAKYSGVLEPLQTATSVVGQITELKNVLDKYAELPVVLIGHSWGAWLCFMLAAQYPTDVKKLILVSSAPFQAEYAANIMQTRINRLSQEGKTQLGEVVQLFGDPLAKNSEVTKLKKFIAEVDSYDPCFYEEDGEEFRLEIFRKVWPEASSLRDSGKLLSLGKQIKCPVIAIHGDYDPHPAVGVQKPLADILEDFKFILLKQCGHTPWIEKAARDEFYGVLHDILFI